MIESVRSCTAFVKAINVPIVCLSKLCSFRTTVTSSLYSVVSQFLHVGRVECNVGRVERSETRHVLIGTIMLGFATLYPTYKIALDKAVVAT